MPKMFKKVARRSLITPYLLAAPPASGPLGPPSLCLPLARLLLALARRCLPACTHRAGGRTHAHACTLARTMQALHSHQHGDLDPA